MLSEFESDESELLDDKDSVGPGVDSIKIAAFPGVTGVAGVVDDCATLLLPPEVVGVAGPLPIPWVAIIVGTICAFFISPLLLKADLINSITGRCPW